MTKDTTKKLKRNPKNLEKMFASHVSNNGLVFSIYKQLLRLSEETSQLEGERESLCGGAFL